MIYVTVANARSCPSALLSRVSAITHTTRLPGRSQHLQTLPITVRDQNSDSPIGKIEIASVNLDFPRASHFFKRRAEFGADHIDQAVEGRVKLAQNLVDLRLQGRKVSLLLLDEFDRPLKVLLQPFIARDKVVVHAGRHLQVGNDRVELSADLLWRPNILDRSAGDLGDTETHGKCATDAYFGSLLDDGKNLTRPTSDSFLGPHKSLVVLVLQPIDLLID